MLRVHHHQNAIATEDSFVSLEFVRDRLQVEFANLLIREVFCPEDNKLLLCLS